MQSHTRYIFHCADIHIGSSTTRHVEYRIIFDKFAAEVHASPNISESIVVIAGDIFHHKVRVSAEDIEDFDYLLNLLAPIPIIIIPGNHDANLNNKLALDLISPQIVHWPNVHYIKQTGIYHFGDMTFLHISVFDDSGLSKSTKLIHDATSTYSRLVLLYHGTVSDKFGGGIRADVTINNCVYLLLAGDIHQHQFMNAYAAYPGSLIQQNRGESLVKGFILWDMNQRTGTFIRIKNDYGFIRLTQDESVNDIVDIPTNILGISILTSIEDPTILASRVIEIQNKFGYQDIHISYSRSPCKTENIENNSPSVPEEIKAPLEPSIQLDIIRQLLESDMTVAREDIPDILRMHSEYTNNNTNNKRRWCLKSMTWSNLFCYGEANVIDFTRLTNVCGIIAGNRSGKSSILDILVFGLFNESLRGDKNTIHRLNTKKSSLQVDFTVNGVNYNIQREDIYEHHSTVKLYKLVDNWINITGVSIIATYKIVEQLIGTREDFLATSMCTQDNAHDITRSSNKDRKKILSSLFGFNDVDRIEKSVDAECKKIKKQIDCIQRPRSTQTSSEITAAILSKQSALDVLNIEESEKIISSSETALNDLYSRLHNISYNVVFSRLEAQTIELEQLMASHTVLTDQYEKVSRELAGLQYTDILVEYENDTLESLLSLLPTVREAYLSVDELDLSSFPTLQMQKSILQNKIQDIGPLTHSTLSDIDEKINALHVANTTLCIDSTDTLQNMKERHGNICAKIINLHLTILPTLNDNIVFLQECKTRKSKELIIAREELAATQTIAGSVYAESTYLDIISAATKKISTLNTLIRPTTLKVEPIDPTTDTARADVLYIEQFQIELEKLDARVLSLKSQIKPALDGKIRELERVEAKYKTESNFRFNLECECCNNNIAELDKNLLELTRELDQCHVSNMTITTDNQVILLELDSLLSKRIRLVDRINAALHARNVIEIENVLRIQADNEMYESQINTLTLESTQATNKLILVRAIEHKRSILAPIEAEFMVILRELNDVIVRNNKIVEDNLEVSEKINVLTIESKTLESRMSLLTQWIDNEQQIQSAQIERDQILSRLALDGELSVITTKMTLLTNFAARLSEYRTCLAGILIRLREAQTVNKMRILQLTDMIESDKILLEQAREDNEIRLSIQQYKKIQATTTFAVQEAYIMKGQILSEIASLELDSEIVAIYEREYPLLSAELRKYKSYKKILSGKDGIQLAIIRRNIDIIVQDVNIMLSNITDFRIKCEIDNTQIDFYIVQKYKLQLELGSGFQKFVTNIIFRLALTHILHCAPEFIIIDEGFGCLDKHNLENIRSLFNDIKYDYKWIMIISHIEEIQLLLHNTLTIEVNDVSVGNKIINSMPCTSIVVDIDKVTCECGAIIKKSSMNKHLATSKHIVRMLSISK